MVHLKKMAPKSLKDRIFRLWFQAIIFPRHPNTWWVGVWTPNHPLRRLLGVPNTYSPGIWRIWMSRVLLGCKRFLQLGACFFSDMETSGPIKSKTCRRSQTGTRRCKNAPGNGVGCFPRCRTSRLPKNWGCFCFLYIFPRTPPAPKMSRSPKFQEVLAWMPWVVFCQISFRLLNIHPVFCWNPSINH